MSNALQENIRPLSLPLGSSHGEKREEYRKTILEYLKLTKDLIRESKEMTHVAESITDPDVKESLGTRIAQLQKTIDGLMSQTSVLFDLYEYWVS
ncbi:MAG: hypothetical protein KAS23_02380 [Anaerohalosphaera sp.]|nr:hypothetical protein [Anaerohalosphaera sp.]